MMLKHFFSLSCIAISTLQAASIPRSDTNSNDNNKNNTLTSSASASSYYSYTMVLNVYIQETGSDPGSTCELRGSITMKSGVDGSTGISISSDPVVNKKFYSEGYGRGRLIGQLAADVPDYYDNNWYSVDVYEEGNWFQGNRQIVKRDPAPGPVPQTGAEKIVMCETNYGTNSGYKIMYEWCLYAKDR